MCNICFPKYMKIAYGVQNVYTLEPAGSHGAWSIDDFNILPYLFGSSELIGSQVLIKDVFDEGKVEELSKDNMYFR